MRFPFRLLTSLSLAAAALLPSGSLHAQDIVRFTAVGGMAYPAGGFAAHVEPAPSYALGASLQVLPQLTLFGRYDVARFDWREASGRVVQADDEGIAAGASTTLGSQLTPRFPLSPWVGIAALFHRLEIEEIGDIEERMGLELQAGLEIAPLPSVRIRPGVMYRDYRIRSEFRGSPEGGFYYLPNSVEYLLPMVDVSVVF